MVPSISGYGASDENVDRDYIAPPGVAPQGGLNDGTPSAGEDNGERERIEQLKRQGLNEHGEPLNSTDENAQVRADAGQKSDATDAKTQSATTQDSRTSAKTTQRSKASDKS